MVGIINLTDPEYRILQALMMQPAKKFHSEILEYGKDTEKIQNQEGWRTNRQIRDSPFQVLPSNIYKYASRLLKHGLIENKMISYKDTRNRLVKTGKNSWRIKRSYQALFLLHCLYMQRYLDYLAEKYNKKYGEGSESHQQVSIPKQPPSWFKAYGEFERDCIPEKMQKRIHKKFRKVALKEWKRERWAEIVKLNTSISRLQFQLRLARASYDALKYL